MICRSDDIGDSKIGRSDDIGDSGGPLILANKQGGEIEDGDASLDVIYGLTSFGQEKCGKKRVPSMYTDFVQYAE